MFYYACFKLENFPSQIHLKSTNAGRECSQFYYSMIPQVKMLFFKVVFRNGCLEMGVYPFRKGDRLHEDWGKVKR